MTTPIKIIAVIGPHRPAGAFDWFDLRPHSGYLLIGRTMEDFQPSLEFAQSYYGYRLAMTTIADGVIRVWRVG